MSGLSDLKNVKFILLDGDGESQLKIASVTHDEYNHSMTAAADPDWDETKVKRDSEGKFAKKAGAKLSALSFDYVANLVAYAKSPKHDVGDVVATTTMKTGSGARIVKQDGDMYRIDVDVSGKWSGVTAISGNQLVSYFKNSTDKWTPIEPQVSTLKKAVAKSVEPSATLGVSQVAVTAKPIHINTNVIYKQKHADGAVVAEKTSSFGTPSRLVWSGKKKKFQLQSKTIEGTWLITVEYGKGEAYKKFSKETGWFAPSTVLTTPSSPVVNAPVIPTKVAKKGTQGGLFMGPLKDLTQAPVEVTGPTGGKPLHVNTKVIYTTKYADGAVVAEKFSAKAIPQRLVWDAGKKKFLLQGQTSNGAWLTAAEYTKKDAYAKFSKQTGWTEPSSVPKIGVTTPATAIAPAVQSLIDKDTSGTPTLGDVHNALEKLDAATWAQLSPEQKNVVENYAQGLNDAAPYHQKLKEKFTSVTGIDTTTKTGGEPTDLPGMYGKTPSQLDSEEFSDWWDSYIGSDKSSWDALEPSAKVAIADAAALAAIDGYDIPIEYIDDWENGLPVTLTSVATPSVGVVSKSIPDMTSSEFVNWFGENIAGDKALWDGLSNASKLNIIKKASEAQASGSSGPINVLESWGVVDDSGNVLLTAPVVTVATEVDPAKLSVADAVSTDSQTFNTWFTGKTRTDWDGFTAQERQLLREAAQEASTNGFTTPNVKVGNWDKQDSHSVLDVTDAVTKYPATSWPSHAAFDAWVTSNELPNSDVWAALSFKVRSNLRDRAVKAQAAGFPDAFAKLEKFDAELSVPTLSSGPLFSVDPDDISGPDYSSPILDMDGNQLGWGQYADDGSGVFVYAVSPNGGKGKYVGSVDFDEGESLADVVLPALQTGELKPQFPWPPPPPPPPAPMVNITGLGFTLMSPSEFDAWFKNIDKNFWDSLTPKEKKLLTDKAKNADAAGYAGGLITINAWKKAGVTPTPASTPAVPAMLVKQPKGYGQHVQATMAIKFVGDVGQPKTGVKTFKQTTSAGMHDIQAKMKTSWTPAQQQAVSTYTTSGGYQSINGVLRNDESRLKLFNEAQLKEAVTHGWALQEALAPLAESLELHRGTGAQAFGFPDVHVSTADLKALEGKTITDPGFVSTSVVNPKGNVEFDYAKKPIKVIVNAPEGTPAVYVSSVTPGWSKENELILGAGTSFRVESVRAANAQDKKDYGSGTEQLVVLTVVPTTKKLEPKPPLGTSTAPTSTAVPTATAPTTSTPSAVSTPTAAPVGVPDAAAIEAKLPSLKHNTVLATIEFFDEQYKLIAVSDAGTKKLIIKKGKGAGATGKPSGFVVPKFTGALGKPFINWSDTSGPGGYSPVYDASGHLVAWAQQETATKVGGIYRASIYKSQHDVGYKYTDLYLNTDVDAKLAELTAAGLLQDNYSLDAWLQKFGGSWQPTVALGGTATVSSAPKKAPAPVAPGAVVTPTQVPSVGTFIDLDDYTGPDNTHPTYHNGQLVGYVAETSTALGPLYSLYGLAPNGKKSTNKITDTVNATNIQGEIEKAISAGKVPLPSSVSQPLKSQGPGKPSGVPLKLNTKVIHTTKYTHGTVVAVDYSATPPRRLVWNGDTKKFDLQSWDDADGWTSVSASGYTKASAYQTFSPETTWQAPQAGDTIFNTPGPAGGAGPTPSVSSPGASSSVSLATPATPKIKSFSATDLENQYGKTPPLTQNQIDGLYVGFKNPSSGKTTHLGWQPQHIFASLKETVDQHNAAATPGKDTVNLLQALNLVDEKSTPIGATNEGKYKQKILDWLQTANGASEAAKIISGVVSVKPSATSSVTQDQVDDILDKLVPNADIGTPDAQVTIFKKVTHTKATALQSEMTAAAPWTSAQKDALKTYTGGSYTEINAVLRKTFGFGNQTFYAQKAVDAQAAMRPLLESVELVRGTGLEQFPGLNSASSVADVQKFLGKTIIDRGFFSASIIKPFAGAALITVEAPRGTPAAYVEGITSVSGEREMLLAAGTKFKVISVEPAPPGSGRRVLVRLRVVP